jgi:ubiquinone/menaquinone biosynthesis C-methylase UbiE
MSDLQFKDTAAAGYDQAVGHWTRRLIPTLLRAAQVSPGDRVLDVAAGTGLATEAAASVVGSSGHVVAADISPAMLEKARDRLGGLSTVAFAVEDAQSLTLADEGFDRVICNMGLMYFPDPARGLSEFRRVLRPAGRAAVSVYQSSALYHLADGCSLAGGALGLIAQHVPSKAAEIERFHTVGRERHLEGLFQAAGFAEVDVVIETFRYGLPSFKAYVENVERGAGNVGQQYLALPEEQRRAVREELGRHTGDADGPVDVELRIAFGSGRR